jgi:hypothetical protein
MYHMFIYTTTSVCTYVNCISIIHYIRGLTKKSTAAALLRYVTGQNWKLSRRLDSINPFLTITYELP